MSASRSALCAPRCYRSPSTSQPPSGFADRRHPSPHGRPQRVVPSPPRNHQVGDSLHIPNSHHRPRSDRPLPGRGWTPNRGRGERSPQIPRVKVRCAGRGPGGDAHRGSHHTGVEGTGCGDLPPSLVGTVGQGDNTPIETPGDRDQVEVRRYGSYALPGEPCRLDHPVGKARQVFRDSGHGSTSSLGSGSSWTSPPFLRPR